MEEKKGWIKLYRSLLDDPIWQCSNSNQGKILITMLLLANHEPKQWEWNNIKFQVQPGQFITSLRQLANKSGKGISVAMVRKSLMKFKKMNFSTYKGTKTGTLITIVNWGKYQDIAENGTNIGTKQEQSRNTRGATNKNDKNDKNVRNKYIYSPAELNEIISYLNLKTDKHFKTNSEKTKSLVNARFKEGYRVDDFKKVIDIKCSQWLNDEKMYRYLQPSTLFSTKFENYLNEKTKEKVVVFDPKAQYRNLF